MNDYYGDPARATGAAEEEEEAAAAAVEAIYDEVLSRIIHGVAMKIHRAAKTGTLRRSDVVMGRRPCGIGAASVKGEKAKGEEDAMEVEGDDGRAGTAGSAGGGLEADDRMGDAAAVAAAGNANPSDGREASSRDGGEGATAVREAKRDAAAAALATKPAPLCPVVPTGGRTAHPNKGPRTDIYGRTPGKDAPYPIPCPNGCGRQITSSRIAQHLEKCLGLTSRRSRGGSGGGTGRKGSGSGAGAPSGGRGRGGAGRGGKGRQGKQAKRKSSKVA